MPAARWRMMLAMKSAWIFVMLCPAFGLFAAPQAAEAPSLEQILDRYMQAVGGKDAIGKVTSRTMKGTLENSDDGTTSPAQVFTKAPGKYLSVVDIADAGQMEECWNGETGWAKDPDSGPHDMSKSEQTAAKRDYDFYREIRLKELFPKMALSGRTKVDESEAYIVEATSPDGATEKLYFDVRSGLLLRRDFERVNIDDGIVLYEVDYDDYKDVDGLKLPSTIRRKTPDYTLTYRFTEIKHNVAIDDAKFSKPEK
jgi:zinc protease